MIALEPAERSLGRALLVLEDLEALLDKVRLALTHCEYAYNFTPGSYTHSAMTNTRWAVKAVEAALAKLKKDD